MTASEVISGLERAKTTVNIAGSNVYRANVVADEIAAMDAAIYTVKAMEEIKLATKGDCMMCRYLPIGQDEPPCDKCFDANKESWVFRWDADPAKKQGGKP